MLLIYVKFQVNLINFDGMSKSSNSVNERILKIGQHLPKIWSKVKCTVFIHIVLLWSLIVLKRILHPSSRGHVSLGGGNCPGRMSLDDTDVDVATMSACLAAVRADHAADCGNNSSRLDQTE